MQKTDAAIHEGSRVSPYSSAERALLRRLAAEVAELAARPIEEEKRELWIRHNTLEETRPVIFCDPENGWNEIIRPEDLECSSDAARGIEFRLRKDLFWGRQMKDDRVIPPFYDVAYTYSETDWGMHQTYHGGGNGGAYVWDAPIKTMADLDRLQFPVITIDEEATQRHLEEMQELLGDILPVRLKMTWCWSTSPTRQAVLLRGLSQIMYDMVDQPDLLHRLMAFVRDANMARLDFLESSGLLFLNNDDTYVGSGGFGWTHQLPQPDFCGRVRARDMWGFSESQETVGVSPGMFEEFVYHYQLPLMNRFGLNCYGCCEPLDKRWKIVKNTPNLRRVSVSPWSNTRVMAENLGSNFILSLKPNPAYLAGPTFDADQIRADLREAMDIAREHHCRMEVIMKDCHTIGRDPQRVIDWTRIAQEEAQK